MDAQRTWVFYVSHHGFFLIAPTGPAWGNPAVIMDRFRFGISRQDYVLGRKWTFQFGRKTFEINPLGKEICEETIDPSETRVTRQVEFKGETYTYHSGKRVSYWEKFPDKKEMMPLWIPDEKHKGNLGIVAMGITKEDGHTPVDIVEVLKIMDGIGSDLDKDLTKLKKG